MQSTIIGGLLIAASLTAQVTKAPTLPKAPTLGSTTTNPTTTTSNPTTSTSSNTIAHPIYLSGKVVLQDGTAPPELVKIERICNGNPRTQGYTDNKGHFQFQVDSTIGVDQDASDPRSSGGNRGSSSLASRGQLAGCDLRATLPGFFPGTLSLTNHSEFDNPDVGIIILRRSTAVDGTTISMVSLNAPKDAVKAYDKGRELVKKEKYDDAERSFQKAVEIYPQYATAWYQLGLLQVHSLPEWAEASFGKSIAADPKYVSPYLSLTLIYERTHRWQKALETSNAVIKLNPSDFPIAHFYRAAAFYNLRNESAAEVSARKTIELDNQHACPQAEKLLGIILTQHQDLAGGSEHLRKYIELAPQGNDVEEVRALIAKNDKQVLAEKP